MGKTILRRYVLNEAVDNGYTPFRNLYNQDVVIGPDGKEYNTKELRHRVETTKKQLKAQYTKYGAMAAIMDSWVVVATFNEEIQTMATDGLRLFINIPWGLSLNSLQWNAVIMHEICHVLYLHLIREAEAGMTDHFRANCAGDYEINLAIEEFEECFKGVFKSMDCLYDTQWTGMPYEDIYDKLPDSGQGPTEPQKMDYPKDWQDGYRDGWNDAIKELRAKGLVK